MNMKEIIVSLFGEYVPVSVVTDSGAILYPSGAAGVDWAYVLGVLCFAIVLYSLLRFVGGLFRR